jgi:hypothetical protein
MGRALPFGVTVSDWRTAKRSTQVQVGKVFWFFFSKKNKRFFRELSCDSAPGVKQQKLHPLIPPMRPARGG